MDLESSENERRTRNAGSGSFPMCGFRLLLGDLGDKDLSHRVIVASGEMT